MEARTHTGLAGGGAAAAAASAGSGACAVGGGGGKRRRGGGERGGRGEAQSAARRLKVGCGGGGGRRAAGTLEPAAGRTGNGRRRHGAQWGEEARGFSGLTEEWGKDGNDREGGRGAMRLRGGHFMAMGRRLRRRPAAWTVGAVAACMSSACDGEGEKVAGLRGAKASAPDAGEAPAAEEARA